MMKQEKKSYARVAYNRELSKNLDDNKEKCLKDQNLDMKDVHHAEYPPVWRKAFTLAENVRFTRTPEVELMRRRIEAQASIFMKHKEKNTQKDNNLLETDSLTLAKLQKEQGPFSKIFEQENLHKSVADVERLVHFSIESFQNEDENEDFEKINSVSLTKLSENTVNLNKSLNSVPDIKSSDSCLIQALDEGQENFETLQNNDKFGLETSKRDETDYKLNFLSDSLFFEIITQGADIGALLRPYIQESETEQSLKIDEEVTKNSEESLLQSNFEILQTENNDLNPDMKVNADFLAPEKELEQEMKPLLATNLATKLTYQKMISPFSYQFKTNLALVPTQYKDNPTQLDQEILPDQNVFALKQSLETQDQTPLIDNEKLEKDINFSENEAIKVKSAEEILISDAFITEKNEIVEQKSEENKLCQEEQKLKNIVELCSAKLTNQTEICANSISENEIEKDIALEKDSFYQKPSFDLLNFWHDAQETYKIDENLERNAGLLENVLEDFGVKGEIIHVRPGPVVTLYEFEPAAGVKSSRVIGLTDDIARSMSAISARVAVIPGRNVIGIELPNEKREIVYLRELLESQTFAQSSYKLALALGKTIGGETEIVELTKMPHLLVAGTTGSGKSVAINGMILSLLYRMSPEECRLIMIDPKMLELSIYDGIPHLLTPVVTDPKKAVTALKWAVREMEDRYRKMAKLGVRNIDGFNARIMEAKLKGEILNCTVQAGFDKETGELLYHEEVLDLVKLPYIVVIVDEMADLMMVAGKEIEGAIQRLAQMARAAGIHLIMATQRPSVDVITGTIKANFPTRISFQVTSKIDSRTILGEQGAETLLGQGDMLHMASGGRIMRVHGPFVSDEEIAKVVSYLKTQGTPEYLAHVTDNNDEEETLNEAGSVAEIVAAGTNGDDFEELYLQAVKIVVRDKKCSTSYIQRRLSIGYNKAASLVEKMEAEGIVGAANHVGKREILIHNYS